MSLHGRLDGTRLLKAALTVGDMAFRGRDETGTRITGRPGIRFSAVAAGYLGHVGFSFSYTQVAAAMTVDRTTIRRFCHRIEDMRDDRRFDVSMTALEAAAVAWAACFLPAHGELHHD